MPPKMAQIKFAVQRESQVVHQVARWVRKEEDRSVRVSGGAGQKIASQKSAGKGACQQDNCHKQTKDRFDRFYSQMPPEKPIKYPTTIQHGD